MKKIFLIILVFVLLTSAVYANEPYFNLKIDTQGEIFADEVLELNISVVDYVYGIKNPTSAMDFSVMYNSEHFEYLGITNKDGIHINVAESVYEHVYGDTRIIMGMIGSVNTITEDGDLITLKFRPKTVTYKSRFNIHSAIASTSSGYVFSPGVSYKDVTIANLYDVNRDGVIDIGDLGIVSYNIGKDPILHYYADINRDGVIDIEDINILMEYLLAQ